MRAILVARTGSKNPIERRLRVGCDRGSDGCFRHDDAIENDGVRALGIAAHVVFDDTGTVGGAVQTDAPIAKRGAYLVEITYGDTRRIQLEPRLESGATARRQFSHLVERQLPRFEVVNVVAAQRT